MQEVKAVVSWRGVVVNERRLPGRPRPSVSAAHPGRNPAVAAVPAASASTSCASCSRGWRPVSGDETETVEKIRHLAESIDDSAWCGIANTIRDPILALLDLGGEHFAEHAAGATCAPETTHGWVAAPCRSTCPSTVDCAGYIFQALEEHPHLATTIVKRDNPLPAIIGRTCPHPCEDNCTLAPTGASDGHQQHQALVRRPGRRPGRRPLRVGLPGRAGRGRRERPRSGGGRRRRRADRRGPARGERAGHRAGEPAPVGRARQRWRALRMPRRRGAAAPARRWPSSAPGRPGSPPATTWPAAATNR